MSVSAAALASASWSWFFPGAELEDSGIAVVLVSGPLRVGVVQQLWACNVSHTVFCVMRPLHVICSSVVGAHWHFLQILVEGGDRDGLSTG